MNHKIYQYTRFAIVLIVVCFALIGSGCSGMAQVSKKPQHTGSTGTPTVPNTKTGGDVLSKDNQPPAKKPQPAKPGKADTQPSETAGESTRKPAKTAIPSDTAQASGKPTGDTSDNRPAGNKTAADESQNDHAAPFNPQRPKLMGFGIGDKISDVTAKFGKSLRIYQINDAQAPVTVYQYQGFSIGFDQNQSILFIEVDRKSVNPGLNGLRIGDTVKQAVKSLGKPTANTGYELKYEAPKQILRLDIDPKDHAVLSIKLFAFA